MKVIMLEDESLIIEILGEPLNETKHIIIIHGDGSIGKLYDTNDRTLNSDKNER